jgi:hypothetical protein
LRPHAGDDLAGMEIVVDNITTIARILRPEKSPKRPAPLRVETELARLEPT